MTAFKKIICALHSGQPSSCRFPAPANMPRFLRLHQNRRNLLGRLFPPTRNEAPTHRDKLGPGLPQSYDVNRSCRGNVVPGPQVSRRLGQPVKLDQFAPRVALGEASAHGANLSHGRLPKRTGAAPYLCSLARRNNMGRGAFERSVRILRG